MQDLERYGDLTFITLGSGTVISLYAEELQRDWFSISPDEPFLDPEEDQDDDDNETAVRDARESSLR